MMSGMAATAGDLAHVWLLTHPAKETGKGGRDRWLSSNTSDTAVNFWLG